MELPIAMPFLPMEAKLVPVIPSGSDWEYQPKWDGFRCVAFRSGKEVELQSKSGQTLTRYFPEIVGALASVKAETFALDGELIVPIDGRLSFDALLQRIHPAASRVRTLAQTHPAQFVLFDFLVNTKRSPLLSFARQDRARLLESFYAEYLSDIPGLRLSESSRDISVAKEWLKTMRGELDGIIAKRVADPYLTGERGMLKIKTLRSADCVVGGFRYGSGKAVVGSLLLGLYDKAGLLNHVGFTSGIAAKERASLTKRLEALVEPPGFTGQAPGGPSRWSTERSSEWQPLKPELVVEVQYDHFTGDRFRHGTKLLRWRPDKNPEQCTVKQVAAEGKVSFEHMLAERKIKA